MYKRQVSVSVTAPFAARPPDVSTSETPSLSRPQKTTYIIIIHCHIVCARLLLHRICDVDKILNILCKIKKIQKNNKQIYLQISQMKCTKMHYVSNICTRKINNLKNSVYSRRQGAFSLLLTNILLSLVAVKKKGILV